MWMRDIGPIRGFMSWTSLDCRPSSKQRREEGNGGRPLVALTTSEKAPSIRFIPLRSPLDQNHLPPAADSAHAARLAADGIRHRKAQQQASRADRTGFQHLGKPSEAHPEQEAAADRRAL